MLNLGQLATCLQNTNHNEVGTMLHPLLRDKRALESNISNYI